jgi:DNA-binding CsgD family transcriptional regulator
MSTGNMDSIFEMLSGDPGVGFSIVDLEGFIRFANARAIDLFLKIPADQAVGRRLDELYGEAWAAERISVLQQILETGRPMVMRHIRHGVRLQSTIRLISDAEDPVPSFGVLTVEGEHEPNPGSQIEVFESELVHLGPLEALTRRELEVLALVGHGLTTLDIAKALHRSPRTIERHLDGARAKLSSPNRVHLVAFARRAGLRVSDAGLKRV